jgi:ABC-2 type transport system permease protein
MRRWLANVFHLGVKELSSLAADRVLLVFIVYSFTVMVYTEAKGIKTEVENANVAVVDNDRSQLSGRIRAALLAPQFRPAPVIDRSEVDYLMDRGRQTFVLDIPPRFEADVLAGRTPVLQLNIDATAMAQAGIGAGFIEQIVLTEALAWLEARGIDAQLPVRPVVRAFFNPNLDSVRHQSVISLVENITMISILLVGAAVIREREHGTIEHLLVMPVGASEIAAAKIWANGAAILVVTSLSLLLVVNRLLGVPIHGSIALFLFGTGVYLFALTALGIMLATVANSMPQFALLSMPVFLFLSILSGASSPIESMPLVLQVILQASPSVQFVKLAHGVIFRGAGLEYIWPQLVFLAGLGALFLTVALGRFRAMLARVG